MDNYFSQNMRYLLLFILLALTGCAGSIYTSLEQSQSQSTGSLEIELAANGIVTVTINDRKVDIKDKPVKSVTISGVPVGIHKVDVRIGRKGDFYSKQDSLRIYPYQKSTMIINNPANKGKNFMTAVATSAAGLLIAYLITGGL